MRKLCVFLSALAVCSSFAFAEEITIDGIAKSASRMRMLARHCPGVVSDRVADYENAFVEVGERSFGKETFDGLLTKEFARREAEYKTQGQNQWCADTEEFLRQLGITDVFQ